MTLADICATYQACESALSTVTSYDHAKTNTWNTIIINTILSQLVESVSAASTASTTTEKGNNTSEATPTYKFVVNSTIIQHGVGSVDPLTGKGSGRRGMHAASGAYWNNEKDGMWSFKYEAGQGKGLDVIVGIVWIYVGWVWAVKGLRSEVDRWITGHTIIGAVYWYAMHWDTHIDIVHAARWWLKYQTYIDIHQIH